MANFVKHEACPSCGSRDNLGRYSDGSAFCFGCHYVERANVSPFVGERDGKSESSDDRVRFPDDATRHLDGEGHSFLAKYGLSGYSIIRANIRWSPGWQQLLFPLYDADGNLCCIQARNFNPKRASKAKYYNVGDKSQSCTYYGETETVVLVEDCVSAIKIGHVETGFPLLGTSITKERLVWLSKRFKRIVVWLDRDKYREARDLADAAKLLGVQVKTVYTENDPKDYSLEQIKEFLL
jgi:hypothetical protein